MSTVEPFDRSLPSPIKQILELRARSEGAVVSAGGLTDLQRSAFVPSSVEDQLATVAGEGKHHLIVVTGSAGGGKTALLERVLERHRSLFGRVVLDATHADSPDLNQSQQLRDFLAPFGDAAGQPPAGPPALLAANTGMLLELFRQLRQNEPVEFLGLEAVLKVRLGISRGPEPPSAFRIAVFNLDQRPTAGDGGMVPEMLARLDFDNPQGIVAGSPRCGTCHVRDWCPVRSNAAIASGPGAQAIDRLVAQAALERGRHDALRQLWDFFSRVLTADDAYDAYYDPCDAVAVAARGAAHDWVWARLLPNALFRASSDLGARVSTLDPSLRPSADAHRLLAVAGIEPDGDATTFGRIGTAQAPALARGQEFIRQMGARDRTSGWRRELGRALVNAEFVRDPSSWALGGADEEAFRELLEEYREFSASGPGAQYEQLSKLPGLLEEALAGAFGINHHEQFFIPIKAYDPRDPSRIFVRLQLEQGESYALLPDPVVRADRNGARWVSHRPLALTVELGGERPAGDPNAALVGGIEVSITLPVFRLLRRAQAGTLASTADLERFYGLRRAVEALARSAAAAARELLVERPGTDRRYLVTRTRDLGGLLVRARELVG